MCYEWWVIEIEWRKLSDEIFASKQPLSIFNTYTHGEMRECLKETDIDVYQKGPKILVLKLSEKLMELL